MEAHNLLHTYGVIIKFPDLTVTITDEPVIGASDHSHDIRGSVIRRVHDDLLLHRGNGDLKKITGLGIVDILKLPPLDVPVATGSDKQLFLLIENNDLDEALVEGGLLLLIEDQVSFHQVAVPEDEGAVLGTAEHLAVGELTYPGDVGEFELTELTDFTLQL
jgi:hypothetical protein